MYDTAFRPVGPTYFVDENAAVQANGITSTGHQSYRIRNLTGASGYIGWSTPNISGGGTPTLAKPAAPTSGNPSGSQTEGVIGMLAGSVEVFTLPPGAWFIAGVGMTFEVQPGEGQ